MPYDNPYNKRVAEEVQSSDAKYILNLDRQYEMPLFLRGGASVSSRSSSAPIGFNDEFDDRMIQNVLKGGCGMCGGSGFGKMTRMDTGFEKSLGSAEIKNFRPNTNNTGGVKVMEKENPELCDMEGSGTKELKDDVGKFDFNRVKDWIGLGKKKELKPLKPLKLPKITNQLVINMIKHAQEKYANDPFYENLMIMLGRIQSGDREMMNSLENKNLLKRIVKDDLLPTAKAMKKNAPMLKELAKMKAKDEKAKRGRKSKMGAGLDFKIARPDEAWKLQRDRAVPMKEIKFEGSGTKEFKEDVGKFDFNRAKDWLGLGKQYNLKGKGWEEFKRDLGSFDFNKVKSWIGLGKYGKANTKIMMGAGWWDDFTNFFTKTMPNTIMKVAAPINDAVIKTRNAIGLGKKNKMGEGVSGGKKAPSAKQLEARRKFTEMVRAKAMKNK